MKRNLLLCLFLLNTLPLLAQQKCATQAAQVALEESQPGAADHLRRLEADAQDWIAATGGISNPAARYTWPSATIPVVVHIVYNSPAEDLPDSQIVSQIAVLNEDFRRLNADTFKTRSIFRPFAADTKIQFCLAARDPLGNPTNGITRTSTAVTGFSFDDHVKFDTSGGIDAWDPAHYLNIWVCNLTTSNGYAYYPNIQAAYDGVVINYQVFGRVGPVVPPYDRGRTTTHEVGHWLGLYHPFEGLFANTGCDGSDTLTCASIGDKICDTPGDITPSYGCDTMENSCTDMPIDFPDQIENFMDYADDQCSNMFTLDQADRMNGFLYTARASLLTSLGCVAVGSGGMDAAVTGFQYPTSQICSGTFVPTIMVSNVSASTMTSLEIDYLLDAGAISTYIWTGSLASGAATTISLPSVSATFGMHYFSVLIHNPNGAVDMQTTNNTWMEYFEVIDFQSLPTFPTAYIDFESNVFPPAGWHIENPDHNYYTWELSSEANGVNHPGSNAMTINNFYLGSNGTRDALVSPAYLIGGVAYVEFDVSYMAPQSPFYSDTLRVSFSDDCGATWNVLFEEGGSDLATTPYAGFAPYVPTADSLWQYRSFSLPWNSGQVKFENISGWGNDLWIDNIRFVHVVGTDPSIDLSTLHMRPNPVQDFARLSRGGMHLPAGEIEITSALGQRIRNISITEGQREIQLDARDLSPGMYFVRYVSEAGEGKSLQWIKL